MFSRFFVFLFVLSTDLEPVLVDNAKCAISPRYPGISDHKVYETVRQAKPERVERQDILLYSQSQNVSSCLSNPKMSHPKIYTSKYKHGVDREESK